MWINSRALPDNRIVFSFFYFIVVFFVFMIFRLNNNRFARVFQIGCIYSFWHFVFRLLHK